jgi:thiol-disulfide isomerase/thioredoxin
VSPGVRIAIATAIAVAAGSGGFLAYSRLLREERSLKPTPAPALSAPAPAPPAPQESTPARAIPDAIPDVKLTSRDGTVRSLAGWKGQPVIVNFWATWCGPCRKEIPLLQKLRRERAAERLEIIGVAVDFRDAVLKYADQMGISYPILIGEKEGMDAAEALGVPMVFPFSVFADRQGRIVTVKIGELHADEASFILDRVGDVDSNRLTLQAARDHISARLSELAAERARAEARDAPKEQRPTS